MKFYNSYEGGNMKTLSIVVILFFLFSVSGCGDTKMINGVEYDTYGLLNADDKKNDKVQYELIWGNLIWGCILVGSVIAPVYFFGFSIFEPVGEKTDGFIKGQVIE